MALKLFFNRLQVIEMPVCDGQQLDLNGSQPCRERPGKVLCKDSDESLYASEYNTVNHDRSVLCAVSADIFKFKSFGQLEIKLYCSALPSSSETVRKVEVKLRSVKCTVTLIYFEIVAKLRNRVTQGVRCDLPVLIASHGIFRLGGKFDVILKAERVVDLVNKFNNAFDLVLYLFARHKDMRVILRKASHAHKSVKRAGKLVAVNKSEFSNSERQVFIRMHLCFINKYAAGAVHRLDSVILIVYHCGIHIFLVMIPVTASFPQSAVEYHRGLNLIIARFAMYLTPVVDQCVFKHHAFRQEERESRSFFHYREQLKLLAYFSVIALFRFLKHFKMLLKQ